MINKHMVGPITTGEKTHDSRRRWKEFNLLVLLYYKK